MEREANGHTDEERYRSYLRAHLKKEQLDLPVDRQIEALRQRGRSKWWHLLINVVALLVFGYSFYYDITQLSKTFFIIVTVVFVINVGLILYQKKQIRELVHYLENRQDDAPL